MLSPQAKLVEGLKVPKEHSTQDFLLPPPLPHSASPKRLPEGSGPPPIDDSDDCIDLDPTMFSPDLDRDRKTEWGRYPGSRAQATSGPLRDLDQVDLEPVSDSELRWFDLEEDDHSPCYSRTTNERELKMISHIRQSREKEQEKKRKSRHLMSPFFGGT